MANKATRRDVFRFQGHGLIPAVGDAAGGPFIKVITGAGPPTITSVTGGGVALALEATSEVQNACLYMGDVLPYDIDDLLRVEIVAALTTALGSAASVAFGVASARNDTIDTIAEAALFRCIGDSSVVVETDDGTNNNDDVSADSLTLDTNFKPFIIDFATGVSTKEPPTASTGRKSHVRFSMGDSLGSRRRVAAGTQFDMSNYSGGLQVFAQIQKTSSTNLGTLNIREVAVTYNLPNYS